MMRNVYFDIETGALPEDEIRRVNPEMFKEPEFRAPANFKDPEKIAAAIEAKRQEWLAGLKSVLERSALSAETGEVLAVGFQEDGKTDILHGKDEKTLLTEVFERLLGHVQANDRIIGHNIHGFDLPFLYRRACYHRIMCSRYRSLIFDARGFVQPQFCDTMKTWAAGERERRVSLNTLGRFFGVGEKTGSGEQFALWYRQEETRQQALDYLQRDLDLVRDVAERMGL